MRFNKDQIADLKNAVEEALKTSSPPFFASYNPEINICEVLNIIHFESYDVDKIENYLINCNEFQFDYFLNELDNPHQFYHKFNRIAYLKIIVEDIKKLRVIREIVE